MTYSIIRMVLCENQLTRRLIWRKSYSSLCSLLHRTWRNSMPKFLQWPGHFLIQHIFLILYRSWDHLYSGTREWIFGLRTRHLILPNTKTHFERIWRMITLPNIDVCLSINLKVYQATIYNPFPTASTFGRCSSDPFRLSSNNEEYWAQKMSLKWHLEEVITQSPYWQLQGCAWIHHLKYRRTEGKLFCITPITTLTL
jgi:hypothetical protein